MLDTLNLVQLIQQQGRVHQSRYQEQKDAARALWQQYIPATVHKSTQKVNQYAVCGIDGSQIYPDRHEGFSEYLINTGMAHFIYDTVSSAELSNRPALFSGFDDGAVVTPEFVNAQRTEYELKVAVDVAHKAPKTIIMFDGALIFWHLQTATEQERFLQHYLDQLTLIKNSGATYAGYISASHSRDLVRLLPGNFDYLVDTDIVEFFLPPNCYTQLFKMPAELRDIYPPELKPCFIYLNVGTEIARIELPAYIAENPAQVSFVVGVVLDQVEKGNGYPVALSEAHEQAVIKAVDRDFFYTMLQMHHQQKNTVSLKLSKKRSAAV